MRLGKVPYIWSPLTAPPMTMLCEPQACGFFGQVKRTHSYTLADLSLPIRRTSRRLAKQPHQLYVEPFYVFYITGDTAEDGDRDRTVGAGEDFPAENVALKFIGAHSGGVVIVRKS